MKKKTPEKILDDVLENLTDWNKDVENVGRQYFEYDRPKYLRDKYYRVEDDIYWTDVETIRVLLVQMFLFNQQIVEDEWTDEVIDRFTRVDTKVLNEQEYKKIIGKQKTNPNSFDKKIKESFVWYCFSTLTDHQIKDCINGFKTDFKDYFVDKMKRKHPKDIVNKKVDKITDTINKLVDKLGFTKNHWEKMLELYL